MKMTIAAVGRRRQSPERDIAERLLGRAAAAGRKAGLAFASCEIPESKAGSARARKEQEAAALLAMVPARAKVVALDEGGKTIDSRTFAAKIADWRDHGVADVVFAIGGPDGHGEAVLKRSNFRLAFGAMTWPHQLARVMLAEQLYRAVTILLGHPYHRD